MTLCGGHRAKQLSRRLILVAAVATLSLVLLASAIGVAGVDVAGSVQPNDSALPTLCGSNPYFVTVRFGVPSGRLGPAVLLFRDSPTTDPGQNRSEHVVLAPDAAIGSVYGLAYDWRRGDLYAAAYHRRLLPFGAGGPGAIYRVDLRSSQFVQWATVDAGPDRHNFEQSADAPAVPWVGRTGLADIEIDDAGREIFAVNMYDGRIYRFEIPSGSVISSFHNGAAGEPWAVDARPFGLGFYRGWLYHAVVNSRQTAGGSGMFTGHVYMSRADGSMMREVAAFDLGYERDPKWRPWNDGEVVRSRFSQPLVSDIEVDATGNLILGLRDRLNDMDNGIPPIHGDVLLGEYMGTDHWRIISNPEFFDDDIPYEPEAIVGALAMTPSRDTLVASTFLVDAISGGGDQSGARWFDPRSGEQVAKFGGNGREYLFGEEPGGGDIESLCSPVIPVYLPINMRNGCVRSSFVDVALVLDMSTSMERPTREGRAKYVAAVEAASQFMNELALNDTGDHGGDQASIVGFNGVAWIEQALTMNHGLLTTALARLGNGIAEGTRLDLALTRAYEAALGDGHVVRNEPVVILLTDGLPNGVPPAEDGKPETTVLRTADALKKAGARIYTVGLGQENDINEDLLRRIASDASAYRLAPDGEDLARIYAEIVSSLECSPSGG